MFGAGFTVWETLECATRVGQVWLGGWADAGAAAAQARVRLAALLRHARAHSPFYRRLYRSLPEGRALEPPELPVTTRSQIMEHFDELLTDRRIRRQAVQRFAGDPARVGQPFMGRYALWCSSGTRAQPAWFLHDANALAVYAALELFRFRGLHSPAEAVARQLAGERYALLAATGGHFAGVACVERLRRAVPGLMPHMKVISLLQPWPRVLEALERYRPHILATYPTAAEALAEAHECGRLEFAPAELWLGGECLSQAEAQRLRRSFQCQVRNAYGASEFLSLAWSCRLGRLHLNADWALLEPVDADYRPVPAGHFSHTVLLTNLANRLQPLIRYDLGDAVRLLPEPCRCGSGLPVIEVQGRADDVLRLHDAAGEEVSLLPLVLETVLEEQGGVHDFQLRQSAPDALRLRLGATVVSPEARRRALRALRAHLDASGLSAVALELDPHPPEPGAAGKLRRVVGFHGGASGEAAAN